MSFTVPQTLACFQILEVPYATVHGELDNEGLTRTEITASSGAAAKTAIETHLAALSADLQTALKVYLDRWIVLGTDTTRLEGSVGNISGLTDDPKEERAEILRQLLILVPFYRAHETMFRRDASAFVPLVR